MITLKLMEELGFSIIMIPKPGDSPAESIIGPATSILVVNDEVRKGIFLHRNNHLLVAFNDTKNIISFGICNNWTKYFDTPANSTEWLLSLNRDKSDENEIKKIFTKIVKNHGR
jgi:hypothetical protein